MKIYSQSEINQLKAIVNKYDMDFNALTYDPYNDVYSILDNSDYLYLEELLNEHYCINTVDYWIEILELINSEDNGKNETCIKNVDYLLNKYGRYSEHLTSVDNQTLELVTPKLWEFSDCLDELVDGLTVKGVA